MGLFRYSPVFEDSDSRFVTLFQIGLLGLAWAGGHYLLKRWKGYRMALVLTPDDRRYDAIDYDTPPRGDG